MLGAGREPRLADVGEKTRNFVNEASTERYGLWHMAIILQN
jgi:hypothetical protein